MHNKRYREERSGRTSALAATISDHPREAVAVFLATAAVMTIFINALFLQRGPHPAPFFAAAPKQVAKPASHFTPVTIAAPTAPVAVRTAPPVALPAAEPIPQPRPAMGSKTAAVKDAPRNDPIAELLAPGKRVAAIQRALAEFGYGQIKPSGVIGPETQSAIEKFERGHKMPVTGQISERLVRELAAMTGRPLE